MSSLFTRRRTILLVLLLVAAGLLVVLWPSFLTETERQMLGSWQYADSRLTYTFLQNRRFVAAFRDGPTRFGRWSAADGNLTSIEYDREVSAIREISTRLVRYFERRKPQTIFVVQFVGQDQMFWRGAIGKPIPLSRVRAPDR